MQSFRQRSLHSLIVVSSFCALLAGCGGKNPEVPKDSADRLQTIYQTFNTAAEQLGRGPKDLEEFKKFLPPGTNADEVLTSPHDGKPYKLVWNVNPRKAPMDPFSSLLAYEQEGKDGMFDVVTSMGIVRCNQADLQKFRTSTPGAMQ